MHINNQRFIIPFAEERIIIKPTDKRSLIFPPKPTGTSLRDKLKLKCINTLEWALKRLGGRVEGYEYEEIEYETKTIGVKSITEYLETFAKQYDWFIDEGFVVVSKDLFYELLDESREFLHSFSVIHHMAIGTRFAHRHYNYEITVIVGSHLPKETIIPLRMSEINIAMNTKPHGNIKKSYYRFMPYELYKHREMLRTSGGDHQLFTDLIKRMLLENDENTFGNEMSINKWVST